MLWAVADVNRLAGVRVHKFQKTPPVAVAVWHMEMVVMTIMFLIDLLVRKSVRSGLPALDGRVKRLHTCE